MNYRVAAFIPFVLATLAGSLGCSEGNLPPHPAAVRKFDATQVTIHQVDPKSEDTKKTGLAAWTILNSKKIDDPALRKRVLNILTRADSYGEQGAKCFDPGMAFSLSNAQNKTIDIVICLECNWAHFYGTDAQGTWPALSKKGRSELARVFKDAFGNAQPSAYRSGEVVEP